MNGRLFGIGRRRVRGTDRRAWGGRLLLERLEERQLLATFTVTNTNNGGSGSLRAAIDAANSTTGADVIQFALAGTGVQTIAPTSPLSKITETVLIDGTTQNSKATTPQVIIDGSAAGAGANGFDIEASGVTIKGLDIVNFQGSGVLVQGSTAVLSGNYIGVLADGLSPAPNLVSGVLVNNVGSARIGTVGDSANVISGNTGPGVKITGSGASNSQVVNNIIGISADGQKAAPNGDAGVWIAGGASTIQIGTGLTKGGNVIAGNLGAGIKITDASTQNVTIQNNAIGVNADGTVKFGNGGAGVDVTDAVGTLVGGSSTATQGNIISANSGAGVSFTNVTDATVQGNAIGTNAAGLADQGNGDAGVLLTQSNNVVIGSETSGLANTIAFNGKITPNGGVAIKSGSNNPILGNSIFSNKSAGIILGSGANNNQPAPVLTSVASGVGQTRVQGFLSGVPANQTFLIEFFSNDKLDQNGGAEGQHFLGSINVTSSPGVPPAGGTASFNIVLPTPTTVGEYVTATATSLPTDQGNTSTFSAFRLVAKAKVADLVTSITAAPNPSTTNNPLVYTVVVSNAGPDPATNVQFSQSIPGSMTITNVQSTAGAINIGGTGVFGSIPSIPSNGSVTVTVTCNPNQIGKFGSTVTVSSDEIDPNTLNNTISNTVVVTTPADLKITVTPDQSPITDGQNLAYQVLVVNQGTTDATNVVITSTLPANASVVNVFTGQGSVTFNGSTLLINLGTLTTGSAVASRVILRPAGPGSVSETFTVTEDQIEETPADNTASSTVNVLPAADLKLALTVFSPTPPLVLTGQNVVYTATVTNGGPATATNVLFTNVLPAGLSFVSATASNNSVITNTNGTVSGNLGTLLPGDPPVLVTLTLVPVGTASGQITNSASVASDEGDLTPLDNTDSKTISVNPADLNISLATVPQFPQLNQDFTYTIDVKNAGPATATNVTVTGTVPTSVAFNTLPAGVTIDAAGNLSATLGTLTVGSDAQIALTGQATKLVNLTFKASTTSDQFDPITTDNTATLTTQVDPADLASSWGAVTGSILEGDPIPLTFFVTNNGPSIAPNATATISQPAGLVFQSYTSPGNTVNFANGVLTVKFATPLQNGDVGKVNITAVATASGTLPITGSAASDALDSNSANDSATLNLAVTNAPGVIQLTTAAETIQESNTNALIHVVRTGGNEGAVSVSYTTTTNYPTSGWAQPGVNFAQASGVLSFADGQNAADIVVPILSDGQVTGPLKFLVTVGSPTGGATLGSVTTSVVTIQNTDVDLIGPTVQSVRLYGAGTEIDTVVVTYSKALDPASAANPANYVLTDSKGGAYPLYAPVYNPATHQVTLNVATPILSGRTTKLVINGSQPNGVHGLSENFLAGQGAGTEGTNYVTTFVRASTVRYIDSHGNQVTLQFKNGLIDLTRKANGDGDVVRLSNYTRKSVLTGTVKRPGLGGTGSTNLGSIVGMSFGQADVRLTSPPFFVNSQFGTLHPPVQLNSIKRPAGPHALFARKAR